MILKHFNQLAKLIENSTSSGANLISSLSTLVIKSYIFSTYQLHPDREVGTHFERHFLQNFCHCQYLVAMSVKKTPCMDKI